LEKPDIEWKSAQIERCIEGPDELGFVTVTINYRDKFETRGQSRCSQKAFAYALKDLADAIICSSVANRGWT
jgi:hypothetical protein